MNHQLRPWIFKHRPKPSPNFTKYQFYPWISLTSIKMVPPSKRSVSDAELTPCMLCCHVHVSKRKSRVHWLNWWKRKKFNFHFSNAIFSSFPFLPLLSLPSTLRFQSYPSKQSLPFSFPLKHSSPSPLQNHRHRWRSTLGFWRTKQSLVKVSLTSISPSPPVRFHHFFGRFFLFSFLVLMISFLVLMILFSSFQFFVVV